MLLTAESLTDNSSKRTQIHRYIFLASLMAVCIGMPLSNGLNSIGQAVLIINWLAEGNYVAKFRSFIRNKPAMVLCAVYVMHILGLLYSTNFDYGLEDINKKVPLLIFPLVLSTSAALSNKERRLILLSFMLSVTCVTFIGGWKLVNHELIDIHDISPYIAPVRLGMMIVLSMFLLAHDVFTSKFSLRSVIGACWIMWLLIFLFVMQSLTSVIILLIICLALLLYAAVKALRTKKIALGLAVIGLFVFGIVGSGAYVVYFYHHYFPKPDVVDMTKLDKTTVNGNHYFEGLWSGYTENGHYMVEYICWKELKSGWNKQSKINLDSNDLKGNPLKYTLIRYMTSKGLRKDSLGIAALSPKDIQAVELGIPNYQFNSLSSMSYRLYQVFWEIKDYEHGGDINGHSVTERFEYWKIALLRISQHPMAGVGTGDVRKAFDDYYDYTHSKLSHDFRLRSHNQYLEIGVGFGLIGLAFFIFSLFYPGIKTKKMFTYFYFVFWMIFMISMFTEDTLETEAGSTFYAFFNSFFLFL